MPRSRRCRQMLRLPAPSIPRSRIFLPSPASRRPNRRVLGRLLPPAPLAPLPIGDRVRDLPRVLGALRGDVPDLALLLVRVDQLLHVRAVDLFAASLLERHVRLLVV